MCHIFHWGSVPEDVRPDVIERRHRPRRAAEQVAGDYDQDPRDSTEDENNFGRRKTRRLARHPRKGFIHSG